MRRATATKAAPGLTQEPTARTTPMRRLPPALAPAFHAKALLSDHESARGPSD
jgi:hypothetical protein